MDFPLADDDSVPNEVEERARKPKPAQPLPRDESEDQEERARLITQILELQGTLEELSQRVESVREESAKLRAENRVLGQYIHNLMASSPLFQPTNSAAPPTNNSMLTRTRRVNNTINFSNAPLTSRPSSIRHSTASTLIEDVSNEDLRDPALLGNDQTALFQ